MATLYKQKDFRFSLANKSLCESIFKIFSLRYTSSSIGLTMYQIPELRAIDLAVDHLHTHRYTHCLHN